MIMIPRNKLFYNTFWVQRNKKQLICYMTIGRILKRLCHLCIGIFCLRKMLSLSVICLWATFRKRNDWSIGDPFEISRDQWSYCHKLYFFSYAVAYFLGTWLDFGNYEKHCQCNGSFGGAGSSIVNEVIKTILFFYEKIL